MNLRRFLTALLVATLASANSPPARAQDPADGPRLERLAKSLDLTGAQRTKMREAGERQMRRGILERADLAIARLDLRQLLRADKPDPKAIDAQVDRIAGMRAQLQKERLAMMLDMRSMLTDAQRAKLRELKAARKFRGKPGPHRMPEGEMPEGGGPPVD